MGPRGQKGAVQTATYAQEQSHGSGAMSLKQVCRECRSSIPGVETNCEPTIFRQTFVMAYEEERAEICFFS